MELQVRLADDTAKMLKMLKEKYEKENGIKFSKGEVLSKAINDTYGSWSKTDWKTIAQAKVPLPQKNPTQSEKRPKFQVSNTVKSKIDELEEGIRKNVDASYVTTGAAIKFVLKLAILQAQKDNDVSVGSIIDNTLANTLKKTTDRETKKALEKFADEVKTRLKIADLL
ncbi:hypothetical protein [Bifidobacterium sp. ESL0745]|uniref:hypothetical protein n=1 Tax=Bifidobacterium sp. ESL0745 TaxID=2983226 RepID=UPI0023F883A5|nr:hypothetical protein [Bifidobacterium sp. ESL0745]MDF7665169.1 hypothetical protein [Bifidobacterium sp. ESL0745]